MNIRVWLKALRIEQWTKNAVVFAAWLFAVGDVSQASLARGWRPFLLVVAMAFSFAIVSSAFYLLNDVSDCEADRLHPVKRLRPIAAGLIDRVSAVRVALALFAFALLFPCYLVFTYPDRTWGLAVLLIYTVMQCLYSGLLKRVPYVDVAIIAFGFVLRAISGAAVTGVRISPWLLACAFSLALFLALGKRHHECRTARASRAALSGYHPTVLNGLLVLSALVTCGVYAAYTVAPDTVARFGSRHLLVTAIFVALGLGRYMQLLLGKADTGRPERILLTDRVLWLILAGYALSAIWAIVG